MKDLTIVALLNLILITSVHATDSIISTSPSRPNILFVFADDWGCHANVYSKIEDTTPWNDVVQTPNFDKLAKEGVLFRNSFVNSPQCTPSRSSILSGKYFFETGLAAIQFGEWDFSIPSFPYILRDAGYHTGYTYKVWSPGVPRDAPFGGQQYSYQKSGTEFSEFPQNVYKLMGAGKSMQEAKKHLFEEVKNNFDDFLADRKQGQPFFYWFGARNPHREWTKGSGKALWGIDPDDLKGKMPPYLPDAHEVREDLADYFGEVKALDVALGLLLDKLEAMGELENTLIVVSGDHGAPGFTNGKCNLYDFGTRVVLAARWAKIPKGRVVDDFVNLMDLAPTFIEAAGAKIPDSMSAKSLMPLLLSAREGQVDPERTWVVTGRERHVSTSRENLMPYPQRSYRNKEFLYIINFKPDRWPTGDPYNISPESAPTSEQLERDTFITYRDMDGSPTKAFLVLNREDSHYSKYYHLAFGKRPLEELYDLRNDPNQLHNLAGEMRYQYIQAELNQKLMDELRKHNDPRVMGDGSTFDKHPYIFERN